MSVYLAIDLGTTGCRSMLFDEALHPMAECYREYGLITPREKWAEQDAQQWWALTQETAREAICASGRAGTAIDCISVSSQGITVVPVDEQLRPLCNALSWLDVRAQEQASRLERDFGLREMFALTGKRIDAAYSLPKILWLREENPEIYNRAWKFLMPMDFLIARLTGRCVTDHSMASGTLLYDIRRSIWSKEILDGVALSEEKLPQLLWSGDVVGPVSPPVARALGLRRDCVVVVGAQDQRCASLGAGLRDGTMTISLGTAAAVCKHWDRVRTEGDTRIGWSAYVHRDEWVTEGVINTAAVCMRWLRETMFSGASYESIDAEAAEALARGSRLLFYPYLNGPSSPDLYPNSQGCFYGMNLATKRGDFALAAIEGVAFQIRILLEAMDAEKATYSLVLFGGGSKSALWCQIIADATGMAVTVPETPEAACAGAAILAGLGAGEFHWDALPRIGARKQYVPRINSGRYAELYGHYRATEHKLWR